MNKSILTTIIVLSAMISCNSKETAGSKKDYIVVIHTPFGDMKAILYDETPLHKANFLKLVENGQYDSTTFHRVMKEFMVQGGDVDLKNNKRSSETIPAEFVDKFIHGKGSLAAARQPDNVNPKKASSWCQFYIVHGKKFTERELTVDQRKLNQVISQMMRYDSHKELRDQFMKLQDERDFDAMGQLAMDNIDLAEKEMNVKLKIDISPERLKTYTTIGGAPHLDTEYTVFGRIVEGLEVIDKIAAQKVARANKPIEDIHMTMELVKMKKKEITKRYGYQYPEKGK